MMGAASRTSVWMGLGVSVAMVVLVLCVCVLCGVVCVGVGVGGEFWWGSFSKGARNFVIRAAE